ncbi:MAG: PqqD family peptide modification chaperone [Candidatus Omnitrophica bacterium]|nr:PqqD family peptide modification chaperone [Candidatus Omnitrophota bacterium]
MKADPEATKNPKVSIIVPAYNSANKIASCLDSLLELNFPKDQREIIVVDNNSTDRTKEIVLRYPVLYVFEKKRTRGAARNKGISIAKGKYIAFTDSDCIVDKDWLKILFEAIESEEEFVACGGKITAYKTDNIIEKFTEKKNKLSQEIAIDSDVNLQVPRVVTANAIFLRKVIEDIGLFDEDLITSEDTELGWRLSFSGYQMKYVPEAIVYHVHIRSLINYLLHQFEYGCASNLIFRKYRNIFQSKLSKAGYFLSKIRVLCRFTIRLCRVTEKQGKEESFFWILENLDNMFFTLGGLCMSLKPVKLSSRLNPEYLSRQRIYIKYNGFNLKLNDGIFWFINNNSLRFYNFKSNLFYKLNETAEDIWSCLVKGKDLSQAIDELSCEYSTTKEIVQKDVLDFIIQLREENILIAV